MDQGSDLELLAETQQLKQFASTIKSQVEKALQKRQYLIRDMEYTRNKLKNVQRERDHLLDLMIEISTEYTEDLSSADEFGIKVKRRHKRSDLPISKHRVDSGNTKTSYDHRSHAKNLDSQTTSIKSNYRNIPSPKITENTNNGHKVDTHPDKNPKKIKKEDPPHEQERSPVKKRKRILNKENRSQPKVVTVLPVDVNGNIPLPVTVGNGADEITVYDFGKVLNDREGYHTSLYIFPVGFRSSRMYPSTVNPQTRTKYTSTITEGASGPVFKVVAQDKPWFEYSASSASAAWKTILEELNELGVPVKINTSGPQLFGLSNLSIVKAIQELPNADKCVKYIRYSWIEKPHPSSINGGAEADKSQENTKSRTRFPTSEPGIRSMKYRHHDTPTNKTLPTKNDGSSPAGSVTPTNYHQSNKHYNSSPNNSEAASYTSERFIEIDPVAENHLVM
ncbi:hypothetical protein BB559_005916 [Furculomyces boomerangus]|uniref:FYR N-terminal domain-containing protein n=2 Tax=Harpellales TaxID=61421 RepID=A0A2T9Y5V9_9FUNG|nr:hypothetical protein BB559_005916 [Furculomyces boomerangus]PWA01632.1 hypothetical protein BB558_002264 [Smittium angustum]